MARVPDSERLIVMLSPLLRQRVEAIARHDDLSLSQVGRRALQRFVEEHDASGKRFTNSK
jgi:hypothetical protein